MTGRNPVSQLSTERSPAPQASAATGSNPAFAAWLFDLLQAPIRWQLIELGFELGLFDRLSIPCSADALAAELALDTRRLALVLDALCAMGALTKRQGCYGLSEDGQTYLASAGPLSLRALLDGLSELRHAPIADLLKTSVAIPLDMADPCHWDRSLAGLRAFHRALGAASMLDCLEGLPTWSQVRNLLDLGAGSEVLACELLARRADLRLTLFDLPPLASRIAEALARDGLAETAAVRAGDYNQTDLGGGYDAIWASMTLYYAHDLTDLCRRLLAALAPGGVFVSFHEALIEERTSPEFHVVGRLVAALRGQDLSFDAGRIADAMRQGGFTRVESRPVATPFGPMRLDVGYRD